MEILSELNFLQNTLLMIIYALFSAHENVAKCLDHSNGPGA